MNDEKKSWLDRAGAVHLWKTIEAMLGTKVDKIEGFGLSSNDYTTEEKKKLASLSDPKPATTENNGLMSSADKAKLDGIEAEANNYTHPVYEPKQAGVYRISVDNTGHVATADKMTSEELAAEGISPADHTHDLGELVDTLDTSADAVEDADTVVVGATVTSDDGSATTKYTRRPLATLWNWIKSRTDTLYAVVGHTHNYAGSPEPGGDALNAMKLKGYDLSMYGSANYWNAIPRIDDAGVMETGKYLDFHSTDNRDTDYNVRMIAYDDGTMDIVKGVGQKATITADLNGTATNASYLNFTHENEVNFVGTPYNNIVYWGYRDNTIDEYRFNDGRGSGALANVRANKFIGSLNGNADTASYISNQGDQTAINSPLEVKGLAVYQAYNNGYPTTYGNVLSIGGTGDGQILAGWSGNNNGIERLYYRNRRDMCGTWSAWKAIAFTDDSNALSAYPVGSIYMSTSSTSPASLFGGTWESIASERVLMGVSSSHGAGSTVDAGLPNISSGSDAALDIQGSWGAPACRAPFAQTWQGNSELSSSTWSSTPKVISARFDASLCNSIYGRSSTVQPAAYYVYMWRRTG